MLFRQAFLREFALLFRDSAINGLAPLCMCVLQHFSYEKLRFEASLRTENSVRRPNPAESCFLGMAGFSVLF
jgi:hypothetical protein